MKFDRTEMTELLMKRYSGLLYPDKIVMIEPMKPIPIHQHVKITVRAMYARETMSSKYATVSKIIPKNLIIRIKYISMPTAWNDTIV